MDIEATRENVCINKLMCEKKELVFIEEDMIVPDSKPDILNAINLNGNICIYKKEVQDGKIKIDGCINTYIMYIPDSNRENIRSLNTTIEFSKVFVITECKENMDADVNVYIKDLECKVLNGRKINIRAGLDFKIRLFSNENIEIINSIDNIDNIQTLTEQINTNSLIGKNSTRVYIKDTLNIDTQDEISEILKATINLVNNDKKISYNKVLSKCEAKVKIIYLTEDNRINIVEGTIPAVGFIDMQNISEDNICDITNEINNITIRPNSAEEHSIYVEVEIETTCTAYEKRQISIIQDLYSPTSNIRFTQKKINSLTDKIENSKNFTVTSKINIPELVEGHLIDVDITPNLNKEQILNSNIVNEGEIIVSFIFIDKNNNVNNKVSKIPFEFTVENPLLSENINVDTNINILNNKFDVKSNGDIDCNIDMEAITNFLQNTSINIIEDIEMQAEERNSGDYDSLIIYIVQKGDTLWKIAKKFKSTVDDIARVNGIEDIDNIQIGQKIYIPKFKYTSKRENMISA